MHQNCKYNFFLFLCHQLNFTDFKYTIVTIPVQYSWSYSEQMFGEEEEVEPLTLPSRYSLVYHTILFSNLSVISTLKDKITYIIKICYHKFV